MADETDSTIPPGSAPDPTRDPAQHPEPDLIYVSDELHAIKRNLDGLSLAVDGLADRRECGALGQLVHLVGRELERLRGYVEEVRPQPAPSGG